MKECRTQKSSPAATSYHGIITPQNIHTIFLTPTARRDCRIFHKFATDGNFTDIDQWNMSELTQRLLSDYLAGNLSASDKLEALLPQHADGCELLVACPPEEFSASAIARAVEDCDARLLALTVTAMRTPDDHPVVLVRADTRNADAISRSLARYGYQTVDTSARLTPEQQSEAMARINELLHYLDL